MSEVIAWSLFAIFAVLAIFFAISYAFECRERRKLESERLSCIDEYLKVNDGFFRECEKLKAELYPFHLLCNIYGCIDSHELRKLIIDLRDKLLLQEKKTYKEAHGRCLAWVKYFTSMEVEFGSEYYRRWIARWTKLADFYKEKIKEGK